MDYLIRWMTEMIISYVRNLRADEHEYDKSRVYSDVLRSLYDFRLVLDDKIESKRR